MLVKHFKTDPKAAGSVRILNEATWRHKKAFYLSSSGGKFNKLLRSGIIPKGKKRKNRTRRPASRLPMTPSIYNPNSKALSCFLDKTVKHNLYTYTRVREASKTGAVL